MPQMKQDPVSGGIIFTLTKDEQDIVNAQKELEKAKKEYEELTKQLKEQLAQLKKSK